MGGGAAMGEGSRRPADAGPAMAGGGCPPAPAAAPGFRETAGPSRGAPTASPRGASGAKAGCTAVDVNLGATRGMGMFEARTS
ncbi:MAG: hypothetical protein N3A38_03180, partial [Planctomycetota bacterium]|nr:hypothetical protein [Planctomycetota bacterium]